MTVSSATNKSTATGNGVTTAFTGSFKIYDETEVLVTTRATDGTETVKILNTDYTVSGVGNSSFTVTFSVAPASGVKVVLSRDMPLTQNLDLVENDPFPSDEAEKAWDRLVMIAQQQQEAIDRSIKFPVSDASLTAELPASVDRAGFVLGFDTSGNIAVTDTITLADLDSFSADVTAAAADAAAAAASASAASASKIAAQGYATAAAASAGSGLFGAIEDKSIDFTVVADTDNTKLFQVNSSGGNINITLPSIATAGEGERYGFLRVSGSNTVTLVRNGSDTINGVAGNYTLAATSGDITLILADDATPDNWIVVPWTQAAADESTLTKTGSTLSVKDDGITLAKLENGTQGDILYYAAGGAPTRLAAGVSGQYLKTNGGGANPEWATVASGLVPIERKTGSAVASYDFTTGISSTYRSYILQGWLKPATDDVDLWLRMSTDGGSTFAAGAGDYSYGVMAMNGSGGSLNTNSNGNSQIPLASTVAGDGVGNSTGEAIRITIEIEAPSNTSNYKMVNWRATWMHANATGFCMAQGGGGYESATAVNALRLLFESGNIGSGDVTLYGVANS